MRKIVLFLLFATMLFVACEKEDNNDSLAGTKWTTSFEFTHNENGKSYDYTRDVELTFTDGAKGFIDFKEVKLPDNIILQAINMDFTYTYSLSSGNGQATFALDNKVSFSVNGNNLSMTAVPQGNIGIVLNFTKK